MTYAPTNRSLIRFSVASFITSVATLLVIGVAAAAEPRPMARPTTTYAERAASPIGRVFVAGEDKAALWRKTVSRVSAEALPIRIRDPDLSQDPPVEGLIETSWVRMPDAARAPNSSRRAVVRFIPEDGGAWLETETVFEMPMPESFSLPSAMDSSTVFSSRPGMVQQAILVTDEDEGAGNGAITFAQFVASAPPAADRISPLPGDGVATMSPVYPDSWAPFVIPKHPALSRFAHKVVDDYRYFYSCESLVCVTGAVGAAALMANTGFDTTMQNAWQQGVEPTDLGTFFRNCKPMGEGKYAVPIFGVAALTGVLLEGRPTGDIVGEWGSRSLRMFAVGGPPVIFLQYATGAPRPSENLPSGSEWLPFHHNGHGASGHAFVGAIPFIAAADMVENPFAKGALYVCSTFTGFSRMTTDSHYPSQVFLGWYLAFASSMAVNKTEAKFAGMFVRTVPMAMNNGTGIGIEGRW